MQWRKITRELVKEAFNWESLAVLAAIVLFTLYFSVIEQHLPDLLTAQLAVHRILTRANPIRHRVQYVVPVEVDDASFWRPPVSGSTPTNRTYLGLLAKNAAAGGALVVGIDFRIKSPNAIPGDDPSRRQMDADFFTAMQELSAQGVGVVLTSGFVDGHREPNIFRDEELPRTVRVGFMNLPTDPRCIPLAIEARDLDGAKRSVRSFALETVDAFEAATHVAHRTIRSPKIVAAEHEETIYGDFFQPAEFEPKISARELAEGSAEAMSKCKGRIVLIGGTWHQYGENRGDLIESFPSPVGTIPGLYLHANYVEALLQGRYASPVPEWVSALLELFLWVLLYLGFHAATRTRGRLIVLLVAALPLFVAYILFTNLGIYLDAVIASMGFFIHLLIRRLKPRAAD